MTPTTIADFIIKRDALPTDRDMKEESKKRKQKIKQIRLITNKK